MARFSSTRRLLSLSLANPSIFSRFCGLCSKVLGSIQTDGQELITPISSSNPSSVTNSHHQIQLPQLIPHRDGLDGGFNIELVDSDQWRVSYGLAQSWDGIMGGELQALASSAEMVDGSLSSSSMVEESGDFDEIEDLRLHKRLFYKLDKGSMEFEENNLDFYRTKSSKKKKKSREMATKVGLKKEGKKSEKQQNSKLLSDGTKVARKKAMALEQEKEMSQIVGVKFSEKAPVIEGKKVRTPTFNQLTDPFHLPFCLDIYISKGSVRSCIVHRVTSKVVVVAHSISKDMKFDLTSRKDATACAAVGKVLAQRAIEDDIHNAVYTPRKGEKIEGKIQIVLQSIIDNGVDVKVKLKQRRPVKRTQVAQLDQA